MADRYVKRSRDPSDDGERPIKREHQNSNQSSKMVEGEWGCEQLVVCLLSLPPNACCFCHPTCPIHMDLSVKFGRGVAMDTHLVSVQYTTHTQ
jgi:hypothetical protein